MCMCVLYCVYRYSTVYNLYIVKQLFLNFNVMFNKSQLFFLCIFATFVASLRFLL